MTNRLRALAREPALWIFLLLLSLYGLTQSGEFMISDGEVVFQTIVALAEHGTLALQCNPGLPQIVPGVNGQCFSKYGLGAPLLGVVFYDLGRLLTPLLAPRADPIAIGHFFVSAMNLALTAATGLLVYLYARDLYRSRWLGLILALLYGVATSAWPYSKVFFSEPLVAFLFVLAAYALFRLRPGSRAALGWAGVAGTAIGFAVVAKVASIIALPFLGLYLLWRLFRPALPEPSEPERPSGPPANFIRIAPRLAARQAIRRPTRRVDPEAISRFPVPLRTVPRAIERPIRPAPTPVARPARRALLLQALGPVVAFGLPLLLCAALVLWHNLVRFGSPLDSGYSDEGFTTPFYVGLYGLLFSSGKSIFLYSPITLLTAPGLVWMWRQHRAEALLGGGIALATLLYYAPWWAWYGGWSWGPRFLMPALPFLVLPLGALLPARRWARWATIALALIGIGVQLLGALVDFNPYLAATVANNPENEARYIFYPWLSPIIAHARFLLNGEHVLVATFDMGRLGFARRVVVLYPALVIGLLLVSTAALVAIFRPHGRSLHRRSS